jgi:hypothetical protein
MPCDGVRAEPSGCLKLVLHSGVKICVLITRALKRRFALLVLDTRAQKARATKTGSEGIKIL